MIIDTIYIGYDPREKLNYDICEYSLRRTGYGGYIRPLKQQNLRNAGLYTRRKDVNAATEFSLTRFLVPLLSSYTGFSLFIDCDMTFFNNPENMFWDESFYYYRNTNRSAFSVACVKHDYVPKSSVKMDGQTQYSYPKKNWSSVMLFNNDHEDCKKLTASLVSSWTPASLHRFEWTSEDKILGLNKTWNFLVGEMSIDDLGEDFKYSSVSNLPYNLHHTLGSPALYNHEECFNCEFGQPWFDMMNEMLGLPKVELNKDNFFNSYEKWEMYYT